jgi:SH3-like domain-containing protein
MNVEDVVVQQYVNIKEFGQNVKNVGVARYVSMEESDVNAKVG